MNTPSPVKKKTNTPAALAPAMDRTDWIWAFVLVAAVFFAFQPAWNGGFLWDDDTHLLNHPVLEPDGLLRAWTPGSYGANYWPLTATVYRLEYELWGLHSLGFHLVNLALHVLSAILAWRLLLRLQMPGALLAAAIFALHPINVESVAWISQLKNVLSLALALLSAICYLDFDRRGDRRRYAIALILFLLSALAKGMLLTLPIVLLACIWWRNNKIERRDIERILPFVIVAALMIGMEIYSQHAAAGGKIVRDDGLLSRAAVAGSAVWFYLGKFFWPANLMFIYPRWDIGRLDVFSFLPGVLLVAIPSLAWRWRYSWGKPVVLGTICYVVLLLPALGFVNIFFMEYSLVADHWQYAASIVPAAAAAALLAKLLREFHLPKGIGFAFGCGLSLVLAVLTYRQSGMYSGIEQLYTTTLARNPDCWLFHNNYGNILMSQGQLDEAIEHYDEALRAKPDYVDAELNEGMAYESKKRLDKAIVHFEKALKIDDNVGKTHYNVAKAYLKQGRTQDAIGHFRRALELDENDGGTLNDLAWLLATHPDDEFRNGDEAVALAKRALRLAKSNPAAKAKILDTLAAAYAEQKEFPAAIYTAQQASDLARQNHQEGFAERTAMKIRLYEHRTPYRENPVPPVPKMMYFP